MKKQIVGGEGKSDLHNGNPKEILTHISDKHSKPNIFETHIHPKADCCPANTGKGM